MRLITRLDSDPTPSEMPPVVVPVVVRGQLPRWHIIWRYAWAAPTSAVALPLLIANAATGGQTILWHGVIEIQGPLVRKVLSKGLIEAAALTLGHVILCADDNSRTRFRAHELVHVRQAERWGPLFLPLYLLIMAWTWRRTGQGYWFHPWEIEAREKSGI